MTLYQFLGDWIQDIVLLGFAVSVLFPFIGIIYPWWLSQFGWNLISFDFAIGVALLPAFLHRVFNVAVGSVGFLLVEALALTAVPLIVIWRVVVIFQTQRAGAIADKAEAIANSERVTEGGENDSALS